MAVDSNAPITFLTTGLPAGYCFTNPQQFALDLVASMYGYIPGQYSTIIISESEPAVADRGKVWFKLEAGGAPTGIAFFYYNGNWVSPNREAAGSLARRIFRGTPAQVWAYDGGDGTDPSSNPPSEAGGAMWEVDTDFAARTILGVGTLPLSGTVVALGDTGGLDEVTLTTAQLPAHTHPPKSPSTSFITGGGTLVVGAGSTVAESFETTTGETGGDDPHQNMPPYVAIYIIKRTARTMYLA